MYGFETCQLNGHATVSLMNNSQAKYAGLLSQGWASACISVVSVSVHILLRWWENDINSTFSLRIIL